MFGAPWWLLGTLAGAGPIIIHFLNRQRFRRVMWAAMAWLLKALERNRRRMRVENLILLIVRVAVVVLLALALAQPILQSDGALGLAGAARVCRILVIDNSYSMTVSTDGTTPLDEARRAADDILAKAPAGDTAVLVVGGSESVDRLGEPTSETGRLREHLETVEAAHRDVNLPAVLSGVAAALERFSAPRIQVYVLTDMQRNSWVGEGGIRDASLAERLDKVRRRASVFLVDCSGRSRPNTAVAKLLVSADDTGEGQGLVAAEVPMTVSATLEHFAGDRRDGVGVRMLVDGRLEGQRTVTLEPRKPTVVQFPDVTFRRAGPQVVRLETDADALSLDDSRDLAIDVEQKVKVLCVNGVPSTDLVSNETYFLERALAPRQFEFAAGGSVFSVETVTDVDFITRNLSDYRLVVLANVFQVPPERCAQLEVFVRGGGGLIIFAGSQVEADAYNQVLYADGGGLLPARILERKSFPRGTAEHVRFDVRDSDHEVIRTLRDRNVDLSLARVREYFYLQVDETDPGVRVLCRYDDTAATPAMVERSFGQGRVVLLGTSASAQWSTFPLMPSFLPFVQELSAWAAGGSAGRRNLAVGEPVDTVLFPGEFGASVSVVTPRKERVERKPVPRGDAFRFEFPDTRHAGVYTVAFGGSKGTVDYCVALDVRESDLDRVTPEELDTLLPGHPMVFVGAPERLGAALRGVRAGAAAWKSLLYAVLALLLLEALLARFFGSHRGIVRRT